MKADLLHLRRTLLRLALVGGGLAAHNLLLWALYAAVPLVTWGARPGAFGLLGLAYPGSPLDLLAPLLVFAALAWGLDRLAARRAEGGDEDRLRAPAALLRAGKGTASRLSWLLLLAGAFTLLGGLGAFGARWVIPQPRLARLGPGAVLARVYDEEEGRSARLEKGLATLQALYDRPGASLFEELDSDLLLEMQTDWGEIPPGVPRWRPEPWTPTCGGPDPESAILACFGAGGSAQMFEHLAYIVLADTPPWDGKGKPPCRSAWDAAPQDGRVSGREFGGEAFGLGPDACALAGLVRTDWMACRGCVAPPDFGAWDPVAGSRLFQRLARLHGAGDPNGLHFDSRDLSLLLSKWTLLPVFWGLWLLLAGFLLGSATAAAAKVPLADAVAEPAPDQARGPGLYRGDVSATKLAAGLRTLETAGGVEIRPVPGLASPGAAEPLETPAVESRPAPPTPTPQPPAANTRLPADDDDLSDIEVVE